MTSSYEDGGDKDREADGDGKERQKIRATSCGFKVIKKEGKKK